LPAPTHVASYIAVGTGDGGASDAGINSNTPTHTMSVTTAIGDRLVAWASMADNACTVATPTGGTGITWSVAAILNGTASFAGAYLWTATATTAETFTLSASKSGGSGTFMWAFGCERFSGASGFGGVASTSNASGAPTVNITTAKANSAIVVVDSDWNAGATTGFAWRTGAGAATSILTDQDTSTSSTLTCYVAYHADSGVAGTYAVGLTAPTGQKYSIAAVEVLPAVPTYLTDYDSGVTSTTTPHTASVTTAVGDVLVCTAGTGRNTGTLGTPTGGTSLTWTNKLAITATANQCALYIWTATATTAETFTCSIARSGTTESFAFNVCRFSNVVALGNTVSAQPGVNGAPSLSITTINTNSAIVVVNADFNAVDGTTRTWRAGAGTLTELFYTFQSGQLTLYCGVHQNAGAAGAQTVGLTAPTGQMYTIGAIEVAGLLVAQPIPRRPTQIVRQAVNRASTY